MTRMEETTPEVVLSVPGALRRGNIRQREFESVAQGVELISLLGRVCGLPDLGRSSVLDMGCGCKLVQAFKQENLPIGRYVGVDVSADLIEFLGNAVNDRRFHFQYLNVHNQMYNPEGEPLTADTRLLLDEQSFDIVCLFSVFMHLAPHDYVAMLKMLRRYVRPDGRLIFSLLLNETSARGRGFWDGVVRHWTDNHDKVFGHKEDYLEAIWEEEPADFLDWDPSQPLKWAIYSRKHALELIEGTGWEVESLHEPEAIIQHYMVCRPV